MTFWQEQQCEEIISRTKIKAGINGSNIYLSQILTNMVIEIGEVFGYDVSNNIPSDLKIEIFAATAGSGMNKLLTGWIPVVGKAVNHASASMMPEEVGQHAVEYFDSLSKSQDSDSIYECLEALASLNESLEALSALFDDDDDDDDDYY